MRPTAPIWRTSPAEITDSENFIEKLIVLYQICAGPSARQAFTANGRGHVRTTTLRLYPAAAAQWAKPREIRRGTPSSIRRSEGASKACQTITETQSLVIVARDPPHWTFRISVSGTRKSSAKIAYSGTTCVIP